MYPPGSSEADFWHLGWQLAWYWFNNDGAVWTGGGDILKQDRNIKNAVTASVKQLFAQECEKARNTHASERGTSLQIMDIGVDSLPLRATLNHPNPYFKLKIDYDATRIDSSCCCHNTFRIEAHWFDVADMEHWYDFLFWGSEPFVGIGHSYPIDISWKSTTAVEKCPKGPYKTTGWPFE